MMILLFRKEWRILINILLLSPLHWEFDWFRNDIQRKRKRNVIIIWLQIGLEIALFSKLEHFQCIVGWLVGLFSFMAYQPL